MCVLFSAYQRAHKPSKGGGVLLDSQEVGYQLLSVSKNFHTIGGDHSGGGFATIPNSALLSQTYTCCPCMSSNVLVVSKQAVAIMTHVQ